MAKRNIEDVYKIMYDMMETSQSLISSANDLVQAISGFGGEIKRVLGEQMAKYFIPAITKLREDTNTPGCIKGCIDFLDSVPLAQTRLEPDPAADYQPDEETLTKPDLNLPASASVDNTADIPQNASYQTSIHEALEKFRVIRKSKPSELGEDVAQTEDTIIGEYNTKEEADQHCKVLNDMVSPEEREYLGTEYEVKEVVFEDGEIKMK